MVTQDKLLVHLKGGTQFNDTELWDALNELYDIRQKIARADDALKKYDQGSPEQMAYLMGFHEGFGFGHRESQRGL